MGIYETPALICRDRRLGLPCAKLIRSEAQKFDAGLTPARSDLCSCSPSDSLEAWFTQTNGAEFEDPVVFSS